MEQKSKRLVAFVGPSGSGKDTLMVKVRDLILSSSPKINVHIVRRMITRETKLEKTENFLSVSHETFDNFINKLKFALHWEIYSTKYGIPKEEIDPYLKMNHIVLVNVSRSVLPKLKDIYPRSKLVVLDISKNLAEERIRVRKRDSGKDLEARIDRLNKKIDIPFPDLILKNEGKLNDTLPLLMQFLIALSH